MNILRVRIMIILSDSIIESFKTRTTFLPTKQSENGSRETEGEKKAERIRL